MSNSTPREHDRVETLFQQAADLPVDQRAAFLDAKCGDDQALREQVEQLLSHFDEDDSFLERPAYEPPSGAATRRLRDGVYDNEPGEVHRHPHVPERLGNYRIIRLVGEGGMGRVFEAEQENPRRRVALKLIRLGWFSESLLNRFKREANLLGRLHHPGIAHIYEAGSFETANGEQPYFAMEFIDGQPLSDYVKAHDLAITQRLELFTAICDAVQHAHDTGIVHRDLKPANILVAEQGTSTATTGSRRPTRQALPKVLDFGIARAIDADVQTVTMNTGTGELLGTLPYMSPEQVSGDPSRIDARTDVYSLGVMLYEMLVGRVPFDVQRRTIVEAARIIQDTEPTRLSTLAPHEPALRGDVETIVAKAIEKDKDRRYATAAELAEDIRRYLRDEPIVARPPSAAYQLRKFARRNKALVGGVVATFVVLVLGLFGTIGFAVAEARQRVMAETAQRTAVREADKLRAVNAFMVDMLAEANPVNNPQGREMTVLEMLNSAAADVEGAFENAPAVEAEVRRSIGSAYRELGEYRKAETHLAREVELRRQLDDRHALPDALDGLAAVHTMQGDVDTAEALFSESLEIRRSQRSAKQHSDSNAGLSTTLAGLGQIAYAKGEYDNAEQYFRDAIKSNSVPTEKQLRLGNAPRENLGALLWRLGRHDEAEQIFRDAVAAYRTLDDGNHPHLIRALNNLAVILRTQGDLDAAENMYKQSIEAAKTVYGERHPIIATATNNLGWIHKVRGDLDQAESMVREALQMRRALLGPDHPEIAGAMQNLALILMERGTADDEAKQLLDEALAMRLRLNGPDHPELATLYEDLARLVEAAGDPADAEPYLREALRITEKTYGLDDELVADSLQRLIRLLIEQDKLAPAEDMLRAYVLRCESQLGAAHDQTRRMRDMLREQFNPSSEREPSSSP